VNHQLIQRQEQLFALLLDSPTVCLLVLLGLLLDLMVNIQLPVIAILPA
jgi:hypothetical protein